MEVSAQLSPPAVMQGIAELVQTLGPATTSIGGRIAFIVRGAEIHRFLLELDPVGGQLRTDSDSVDADTTVHATPKAFAALFADPEKVPRLVRGGSLVVTGDQSKLSQLSEALCVVGSPLALRLAVLAQAR